MAPEIDSRLFRMSTVRSHTNDPYADSHNLRTRSTSTGSRTSSNRSLSSRESNDSIERVRRSGQAAPEHTASKPSRSVSFSRLFGTKEPSLDAFKHLADLQQKELDKKGQKLPFGVPQAKLPSSAKDDLKKAKQRAKERAKLHEIMKEKMKLHEEDERRGHVRRPSSTSTIASEESLRSSSIPPPYITATPRSPGVKKFSALDPLPEVDGQEGAKAATYSLPHPSPPIAPREHNRHRAHAGGLLTGSARKDALPWE